MKIIHISPAYKPAGFYGGPTASVSYLCEALIKKCYVEVITTQANGKTELGVPAQRPLIIDGVPVRYFKRITKDHTHFSPSLLWYLYLKLRKNKEGVIVHIHSWWNTVVIFSCLIAKCTGTNIILSPRGMLTRYTLNNRNPIFKTLIHNIIGKPLIAGCYVHATTFREQLDILQTAKPKRIIIIPNFVHFPYQLQIPLRAPFRPSLVFRLIFLSRIEEKKGMELLFKSLTMIRFPWKLTIAGTGEHGYIDNLKKLTATLGISEAVDWIGQVTNRDKYRILANHDLLTLFSYNENFANVVIESLVSGTPVAISEHVGLSDYVIQNDLGWVSELNCTAIAQTLTNSFNDYEKRIRINKMAPLFIKKDFSEYKLLKQYFQLYNKPE